jgi:hypothetical protein
VTYRQAAIDADRAVMQAQEKRLPIALMLILIERAEQATNDYIRHGDKEKN